MTFENLRQTWDTLGRKDPLWAVLSDPAKRNNRWNSQEFFRTGEVEVAALFDNLRSRDLEVKRGRCLDFGCGVGRLTQAFCAYFEEVDGVDIAQSMLDQARERNQYGARCRYHLNVKPDLRLFESATFDLVYSVIVLQHMVPDLAEKYLGEFMRVLVPGGIAVFQVPSRYIGPQPLPPSRHQAKLRLVIPVENLRVHPAATMDLTVEVTNASPAAWPAYSALSVGNHWLDQAGQMVRNDDGRSPIEQAVGPGEHVIVPLRVTAPDKPGGYSLELDVVEEGLVWFGMTGSPTLRIDMQVAAPRLRSIASRSASYLGRDRRGRVEAPTPAAAPFEMHALPQDRVITAVESAGGEILAVEENYASGPGWENYRYFARRVSPERLD